MPQMDRLLVSLFALCVLASAHQQPYDCSAIQLGNRRYDLSPLGGDYEATTILDESYNTTGSFGINVCEDLNAAVCTRQFCHTSGNVWARYESNDRKIEFAVSLLRTFDIAHPYSVRPLEDREGLTVEFFLQWPYMDKPSGTVTVDFACDPNRSGLDFVEPYHDRRGDIHGAQFETAKVQMTRQGQESSLRVLSWSPDGEDPATSDKHLHMEWRTRQACDDRASINDSRGIMHELKNFVGDRFGRPWNQMNMGL